MITGLLHPEQPYYHDHAGFRPICHGDHECGGAQSRLAESRLGLARDGQVMSYRGSRGLLG